MKRLESSSTNWKLNTWKDPLYSDYLIKIDDVEYKVHRFILCSNSFYFESLFRIQDKTQAGSSHTDLSNLRKEFKSVWTKVLDYLYNQGTLNPLMLELVPLIGLCDYLGISSLQKISEEKFQDLLLKEPTNSLVLYCQSIQLNQEKCKELSKQVVSEHFSHFLPKEFLPLPITQLLDLLVFVVNQYEKKHTQQFYDKMTELVVMYLENLESTENQSSKAELEKLLYFGINGKDAVNTVKLLYFAHHHNHMRIENHILGNILNRIDIFDKKEFLKFDISLFKNLLSQLELKHHYDFYYSLVIDYFKKNEPVIDKTMFDEVLKKIYFVQIVDIDLILRLSERFNDLHFDKCITCIVHHFQFVSIETILKLSVEKLFQILSDQNLQVVPEVVVFDVIQTYIKNSTLNKEQKEMIWKCCRFGFLPFEYLINAQDEFSIPESFIIEGLYHSKYLSEKNLSSRPTGDAAFKKFQSNRMMNISTQGRKQLVPKLEVIIDPIAMVLSPFLFLIEICDEKDKSINGIFFEVSILTPRKKLLHPFVTNIKKGKYQVQFTPTEIGNFEVYIHRISDTVTKKFVVDKWESCSDLCQVLHCFTTKQPFTLCDSMTTLDLHGKKIGIEGAKLLACTLKINSSLTELQLNDNSIGNEGLEAFSYSLLINTTLQFLNLSGKKIYSILLTYQR
eukprot:TRINITY_DN2620_c0_g1_i5.p1 TRINITY_DN2620_c0_g1~~TRINITY_DN2620_c0_g1_i5.p1  ORF type:complete len:676 (+),score=147.64 TRINITY_DN2620_c0_g1_i5:82-2109(+)